MADISDRNIQLITLPVALAIYRIIKVSRGLAIYGHQRQVAKILSLHQLSPSALRPETWPKAFPPPVETDKADRACAGQFRFPFPAPYIHPESRRCGQ